MITTLEQAQTEVEATRADFEADNPDAGEMEIDHGDVVVSVCHGIEDDEIALELCRVELGFVPYDLRGRLGDKDWLDS